MYTRILTFALLAFPLALACRPKPGGGDTAPNTGSDADADTDADADADADTDTPTHAGDCQDPTNLSTWYGTLDPSLATATNYSTSAGIAAVRAATPATDGDSAAVNLPITGAIITAVGYAPVGVNPDNFWLQDADIGVHTYFTDPGQVVAVGDSVSFTVTEVTNYGGTTEITGLSDFTDDSSGNKVYVKDSKGQALDYATEADDLVRVWGRITGEGVDCGPVKCYPLDYGAPSDITVRTGGAVTVDSCVEVMAPLGSFDGALQLDLDDFDSLAAY
jgi:hypothetical protein